MISEWFLRIFGGKEHKTEVRDSSISAALKLDGIMGMTRETDARFGVSKTLKTLDETEIKLTEAEPDEKPGAISH